MKGDFSRNTFRHAKARHYAGVLMQQGRVQLDADWNEQGALQRHRTDTDASHTIGPSGAPEDNAGFEIRALNGDLEIGPGSYYVDGVLCENDDAVTYTKQPWQPPASSVIDVLKQAKLSVGLVYLDLWQRHVTAYDDDQIREPALGGPDTTTRLQTVWRVRVLPVDANANMLLEQLRARKDPTFAEWRQLRRLDAYKPGRLAISTAKPSDSPPVDPCTVGAPGGYRGIDNQLYRVEIHTGGKRDKASFKWSRENGSVAVAVDSTNGSTLTVRSMGRDADLAFSSGQWVELIGANQTAGRLHLITRVDPGTDSIELDTSPNPLPAPPSVLRRWDQPATVGNSTGLVLTDDWIELEHGLRVRFDNGLFEPGDYWTFAARYMGADSDGTLDWPNDELRAPFGVEHHYAPLAVVQLNSNRVTVSDCRILFPPLSRLTAERVTFDPSGCGSEFSATSTVQDAIDKLCQRNPSGGGACDLTAIPGAGWEAVFQNIRGQNAQICLPSGDFLLTAPVRVTGKGHVTVRGSGDGSRILADGSEIALFFEDCKSVTIRDLYVQSNGAKSPGGEMHHLNGTLTLRNCGKVVIDGVTAKCDAGSEEQRSCINVWSDSQAAIFGNRSVRIQRCDCFVGDKQIGILLVNASRIHVEDNQISAADSPTGATAIGGQGIVVGGRVAEDVRILDNTIRDMLQGVRIGVSHRESKRGQPDKAGNVAISRNTIVLRLPLSEFYDRFGIFVGNCRSLIIDQNYLALFGRPPQGSPLLEGVRVYGHLGKRVIIRHNHLEQFGNAGIYFGSLTEHKAPVWRIEDNVASVRVKEETEKWLKPPFKPSHNYA